MRAPLYIQNSIYMRSIYRRTRKSSGVLANRESLFLSNTPLGAPIGLWYEQREYRESPYSVARPCRGATPSPANDDMDCERIGIITILVRLYSHTATIKRERKKGREGETQGYLG